MPDKTKLPIERVKYVIDRLLDPENGCPWDLKQTPETTKLHLLEEVYELLQAIEDDSFEDVKEELGDCLFLLCFLAKLYQKQNAFDLDSALNNAADKMISRHPHIFGEGRKLENPEDVKIQWHKIKQKEKNGARLSSVPRVLPALQRAHRLTERAGKFGFDWQDADSVLDYLDLESVEFKKAVTSRNVDNIHEEIGDILFTIVNISRHLKINAEDALRSANDKFIRRFEYIEKRCREEGIDLESAGLEKMDQFWDEAKRKGL